MAMPRTSPTRSVHASNGPNDHQKREYLTENGNLQGSPTCPAVSKAALAYCSSSPSPSTVRQEYPEKISVGRPDTETFAP